MKFPPVTPSTCSKTATLEPQYISNSAITCTGLLSSPSFLKIKYLKGRSKSFEWYLGLNSWRASAAIWNKDSYYRHSKSGERILADAGWHCSYCFRTLPEYIVKMRGFSHADRIAGRLNLLDPKRIQDTICKGKDIFGMFPEAYSVSKQPPLILQTEQVSELFVFPHSISTYFLR